MERPEKAGRVSLWLSHALLDSGVKQIELAKHLGLLKYKDGQVVPDGAVITRYINDGPAERGHLSAKWTRIIAMVIGKPAAAVIAMVRPTEGFYQRLRERLGPDARKLFLETPSAEWHKLEDEIAGMPVVEARDIMDETPAEVVQALAAILGTTFEKAYDRLRAATDKIATEEWD